MIISNSIFCISGKKIANIDSGRQVRHTLPFDVRWKRQTIGGLNHVEWSFGDMEGMYVILNFFFDHVNHIHELYLYPASEFNLFL